MTVAVYTRLKTGYIETLSIQCGIRFDPDSLNFIEDGSTDSCYSLVDDCNRKYFLKVHENQETSPHALNVDQRDMVMFAHYLSTFNHEFNVLNILAPYRWRNERLFGFLDPMDVEHDIHSQNHKLVSIWPFITPKHPSPIKATTNFDLEMINKFAQATAELHNVSSRYSPKRVQLFPKDITDTEIIMKKIDQNPNSMEKVSEYLSEKDSPYAEKPDVFLQLIRERVHQLAKEWRAINSKNELERGYIHGELKPSNTLIGDNGEMVFIDICKSGFAPLTLELGMAAQNFTNPNAIYIKGVEKFIESYLSVRKNYSVKELRHIPFMIKVSAMRLAVYRTFAVASGYKNQKLIHSPLHVCMDIEEMEEDLISAITS